REDRRGGAPVRRQGCRSDAVRGGAHRPLPARARRVQGAEGGALPRRAAEVERRQDPAQGPARDPMRQASTMTTHYRMATAPQFVGRELGTSAWVTVSQDRIDQFAACTGDRQWIHVDVERARRESPFGGPVAHGYLSLSLVAAMVMELGVVPPDAATGLNYG